MEDKCCCEHYSHFSDLHYGPKTGHDYGSVPAGYLAHPWVGGICNDCAAGCLAVYSDSLLLSDMPKVPSNCDCCQQAREGVTTIPQGDGRSLCPNCEGGEQRGCPNCERNAVVADDGHTYL